MEKQANEIRCLAPPDQWHYCASEENPADIPSRGADPKQLTNCELRLHGPKWLQGMNIRQDQSDTFDMPEECATEQRCVNETDTHTLLMPVNQVKQVMLNPVINPH